jgi:hypothetical protein
MNIVNVRNYDILVDLPSDENPVSENETKIVNMLFKEKEITKSKCNFKNLLDVLIVCGLFAIISLPVFDSILRTIIIFQDEQRALYIILILKAILMALLFWMIKSYFL